MITLKSEEEIMVWMLAVQGYRAYQGGSNGYSENKRASESSKYADEVVEEFRKRVTLSKE